MAADPAHNILLAQGTGLPSHLAAAAEYDQRRDTDDPKPRGQGLFLLRIHFGQANLRFQHLRRLFIGRGHHAAGTAPGGPEIYHQGNLRSLRMQIEIRRRQSDRVTGKQGRMALTAIGLLRQTNRRNAIDTPAMRADQMERLRHRFT